MDTAQKGNPTAPTGAPALIDDATGAAQAVAARTAETELEADEIRKQIALIDTQIGTLQRQRSLLVRQLARLWSTI